MYFDVLCLKEKSFYQNSLIRFSFKSYVCESAVVVAQLVEWSILTPEARGSNPVIGKILSTKLTTNCIIEKTKIKKKWPGMAHL